MSISLHYINGPGANSTAVNTRQSKTHSASGPLSINWANGDMVTVSASANITGFVDSNRPDPGYVTLKITNSGSTTISLDFTGTDLQLAQGIPAALAPGEPVVLFGIEV